MSYRGAFDPELVEEMRRRYKRGESVIQLIICIAEWNKYDEYEAVLMCGYFRTAFSLKIIEVRQPIGARLPWSPTKFDKAALIRGDFGDFDDVRALIELRRDVWDTPGSELIIDPVP